MGKGNGKSEVDYERDAAPEREGASAEAGAPENQGAVSEAAAAAEELRRVKQERDLLYERLARQQAEFENLRKRMAREQGEHREYALAEALKGLLPILDSFDRAVQTPAGSAEEFRAGMELIDKQLHDFLEKLGVRRIPAAGEPFDPYLHQAVEMVETTEVEDQHVLEELQRGYKLKDRLLRPAMVRVARNPQKK